jgi:hypothetical protein
MQTKSVTVLHAHGPAQLNFQDLKDAICPGVRKHEPSIIRQLLLLLLLCSVSHGLWPTDIAAAGAAMRKVAALGHLQRTAAATADT